MNVNPVTAPGATSAGQVEIRARGAQAPQSAVDRGQVLQRDSAPTKKPDVEPAKAFIDSPPEADDADRQKAEQLRSFIANDKFNIRAHHDENSGRQIIEIRDQTTGELVTQYPSEELIRLYSSLRESLVDQRA